MNFEFPRESLVNKAAFLFVGDEDLVGSETCRLTVYFFEI
jgi:hypothetical protein